MANGTDVALAPVLCEAEVTQFWEQGYLLLRGVLPRDEAERYRQLILDVVPRDLTLPADWGSARGRIKPYHSNRDDCWDTPELLALFANERLVAIVAQLLETTRLRVFDGSLGITLRDDAGEDRGRSQNLHLDCSVPPSVAFAFTLEEVQLGGCFYFSKVEPGGGGIHVVPRGHRLVEEEARAVPNGRHLYEDWKNLGDLDSVEVTGDPGDFVLLHHLMPHAASYNRRPTARVAQFLRFVREDQPHGYGRLPPRQYSQAQLDAISPLGRCLLGLDSWGQQATGGEA